MKSTEALAAGIENALKSLEKRAGEFRKEEEQKHLAWQARLEKLGRLFDELKPAWQERLDLLVAKFGDKLAIKPTLTPSTRDARLEFQSEVARVVLRFRATTDQEITKLILVYDLEIVPVLMQFDSHAEFEQPLEKIDRDAMGRWIDERILSFVKTYVSLHEDQYYCRDQMVEDPISGTRFPKFSAGATLTTNGKTYYFVGEETKRLFEQKKPARSVAAAKS